MVRISLERVEEAAQSPGAEVYGARELYAIACEHDTDHPARATAERLLGPAAAPVCSGEDAAAYEIPGAELETALRDTYGRDDISVKDERPFNHTLDTDKGHLWLPADIDETEVEAFMTEYIQERAARN